MGRIVCQFSCGATSAVAAKLTLKDHPDAVLVNAFIKEEDEDNRRFLADCERWFDRTIIVVRDEKYGASVDEVWRRKRFMKGEHGAPCSMHLKREILAAFMQPTDILVLGYDAGESDRLEDFREFYPHINVTAPLIERGLTKSDCQAIVERAGIQLPLMYRDGFENANCPGCPKGGMGYWNRIRIIRPERFKQVMTIQEEIGPGAYFFFNRDTLERFGLKNLDPKAGRHNEPAPSCSFFCELAERELEPT